MELNLGNALANTTYANVAGWTNRLYYDDTLVSVNAPQLELRKGHNRTVCTLLKELVELYETLECSCTPLVVPYALESVDPQTV